MRNCLMLLGVGFGLLGMEISTARGECTQPQYLVQVESGKTYGIAAFIIDNRVEVLLNGKLFANWIGNGRVFLNQDFSPFFQQKRENVIVVRGYNQAYTANMHDPNPGIVSYIVDGAPSAGCEMKDWRGNKEYRMFEHVYTYVDTRYDGRSKKTKIK